MQWLADFVQSVSPIATILGWIAVAASLGATLFKVRQYLFKARDSADQSTRASKAAVKASIDTTVALETATAALNTVKDQYDDLMAAYVRTQTIEGRVRLLERFAEHVENQLHLPTRVISTTGAQHADD